jgi:glycosyltransferase involved in cell wall biosynthesis
MNRKVKILHVAETIKGGVATYLGDLCREQISSGRFLDVKVLCPFEQSSELSKDLIGYVYTIGNGRSLGSVARFTLALLNAVKDYKPDVIHLHSSIAGGIGRILLWHRRSQLHYCPHGLALDAQNSAMSKFMISLTEGILSKFCATIICISEYEYNQLQSIGVTNRKLKLIPNAISTELITVLPRKNIKATRFLFVGRLDKQKGFDLLVKAFNVLGRKDISLDVVGERVVNLTESDQSKTSNINFLGWLSREQVFKQMSLADFLVMPSRWEGFGLVAAEAIASGLPVIASSAGALPSVVHNGVDGIIFTTGDIVSLVKAIECAIEEGPVKYSDTLRTSFYHTYTMKDVSDNVIKVYYEYIN